MAIKNVQTENNPYDLYILGWISFAFFNKPKEKVKYVPRHRGPPNKSDIVTLLHHYFIPLFSDKLFDVCIPPYWETQDFMDPFKIFGLLVSLQTVQAHFKTLHYS